MKYRLISIALTAAVLSLGVTQSYAADNKADALPVVANMAKASLNSVVSEAKRKAVAKIKLVDINSVDKAALKKLPGISDAEADKIIAGRPYLSKAHLVTQNILAPGAYENIKFLVIAKQNKATEAKLNEMLKKRKTP